MKNKSILSIVFFVFLDSSVCFSAPRMSKGKERTISKEIQKMGQPNWVYLNKRNSKLPKSLQLEYCPLDEDKFCPEDDAANTVRPEEERIVISRYSFQEYIKNERKQQLLINL